MTKQIRGDVYKHIIQNCKEKEIFLQAVNGYTDHIHWLISLGRNQTIAEVARLIKGESAFRINRNNLVEERFSWQDDYFAVSVSESKGADVIAYIKNQEDHYLKKSFDDEAKEFMTKYGWSPNTNKK